MSEIKLETMTSVHIGSGNFLQYNTEYVHDRKQKKLFVIDERKVLKAIGEDNLDNWVLCIERGENIQDFVQRCHPGISVADYSKRGFPMYGPVKFNETLKEQMHDGMGRAYIPGSSIKGAIRSAVLASCVGSIENIETKVSKFRVSANAVEEELFGKVQTDIFKYLQVGDAFFSEESEVAFRMTMALNITKQKELDSPNERKPQIVEAIRPEEKTTLRIKLDERLQSPDVLQTKVPVPPCMRSLPKLFAAINAHTRRLVVREIGFWEEISEEYEGADLYLSNLEYLLEDIDYCKEGQCILRVGHGSGWDFITGGWAKDLQNFKETIVPAARPRNFCYEEYPFPKSRRLDDESEMLGFIKLSL